MEEKKVVLSVEDLVVKFHVRGRILTAIRNISLDIYENESIAIVGESGSGKSVFTKTFAGMLDSNGFIDHGNIIYNDEDLSKTDVKNSNRNKKIISNLYRKLNNYSVYEFGSEIYKEIQKINNEYRALVTLSDEENDKFDNEINNLVFERTELFNYKQTLDSKHDKDQILQTNAKMKEYDEQIKKLKAEKEHRIKENKAKIDSSVKSEYDKKLSDLKAQYRDLISSENVEELSEETKKRNEVLAKEIYLSVGRFDPHHRNIYIIKLLGVFKKAMIEGEDLSNENLLNDLFDKVVFRVKYISEDDEFIHGNCIINLAKIKYSNDWQKIRGTKIATVFQDPMTSLNPVIPIGKQISSIIIKHQKVSEVEARKRAIELMQKVGIPDAENRYDDYPFQYSGGMRQRIVIAIALSCQPKILICDEPTTALDVTIQAQILKLIKDLQKEFKYTIVFITHDLGVVANVAERVAVLYAGQIVEVGNINEVFYDPRHPYTWALFSSLPQLADRSTQLYSIEGTPPSLYNKIVGDPFAPRNPYCMKIDTLKEPPMFKVTDTHYAKTWLLDPRAPKIEKPEIIRNIHDTLVKVFNVEDITNGEEE